MSMAKVILIGNLGQDPETRYTPNGRMNVRFSMATNRRWTDQSGQQQERTTWFRVTAWGRSAETLDNFSQQGIVRKGTQLFVMGRLEAQEYVDNSGQQRQSLEVTLDEFQLLGSRGDSEGFGGQRTGGEQGGRDMDTFDSQDIDDIPF
jgi:single-strand DNA-binding protein